MPSIREGTMPGIFWRFSSIAGFHRMVVGGLAAQSCSLADVTRRLRGLRKGASMLTILSERRLLVEGS
jgi:hypothetical protein